MWTLIGCNVPFTILLFATLGSIVCSFIIGTEVETRHINVRNKHQFALKMSQFNTEIAFGNNFANFISPNNIFTNNMFTAPHFSLNLFPDKRSVYNKKKSEHNDFIPIAAIDDDDKCPATSLEALRKRHGTRKTFWGDWTNLQTREFYKMQLPRSLQAEDALGLSLEERARLASEARHALRLYVRERCHLPGRIVSRLYDGCRHLLEFGSWNPEGMSWREVKMKYMKQARAILSNNSTLKELETYVYRTIVDKACRTNELFDQIASSGAYEAGRTQLGLMYNHMVNATNNACEGAICLMSDVRDECGSELNGLYDAALSGVSHAGEKVVSIIGEQLVSSAVGGAALGASTGSASTRVTSPGDDENDSDEDSSKIHNMNFKIKTSQTKSVKKMTTFADLLTSVGHHHSASHNMDLYTNNTLASTHFTPCRRLGVSFAVTTRRGWRTATRAVKSFHQNVLMTAVLSVHQLFQVLFDTMSSVKEIPAVASLSVVMLYILKGVLRGGGGVV